MKLKKILIVPDTHVPYHDEKAFSLMLKVGKAIQPDIIITLGDFADFYCVSSHSKNPNRRNDLKWEVEETVKQLRRLDNLGAKDKYFVSGNHEDRLSRYLHDKAPELFSLYKIPDILKLKEMGWHYTAYKEYLRIGKLNITHDVGQAGKNAVFGLLSTFQTNAIMGHTHRLCYIVEGNARGEAHVGATFGWLGDKDQTDYMHKVKANRDWALGFGMGYMDEKGVTYLQPVPIVNYSCVVEGKLFNG